MFTVDKYVAKKCRKLMKKQQKKDNFEGVLFEGVNSIKGSHKYMTHNCMRQKAQKWDWFVLICKLSRYSTDTLVKRYI